MSAALKEKGRGQGWAHPKRKTQLQQENQQNETSWDNRMKTMWAVKSIKLWVIMQDPKKGSEYWIKTQSQLQIQQGNAEVTRIQQSFWMD